MNNNFDIELLIRKDFEDLTILEKEFILQEFTEEEFKTAQGLTWAANVCFEKPPLQNQDALKEKLLSTYKKHHKKASFTFGHFISIWYKPALAGVSALIIAIGIFLSLSEPSNQPIIKLSGKPHGAVQPLGIHQKKEQATPVTATSISINSHTPSRLAGLKKHRQTNTADSIYKNALCYDVTIDSLANQKEENTPGLYTQIPEEPIAAYNNQP